MKILVNAIPLVGLLTGISRYVRQLYQEIEKFPDVEVFYFDGVHIHSRMPDQANPGPWIKTAANIWKLPDPVVFLVRSLALLKYEWMLRRYCRSGAFDIYHETGFLPAAQKIIPTVYTLYDLSLSNFPNAHPAERVWLNKFFFPRRIDYATHFLTISDFIRQEINEILHIPLSRISSVHLAPSSFFHPRPSGAIRSVWNRFGISGQYLLFVGSLEPRKNLSALIQALQKCRTNIPLVLTGWEGWGSKNWLQSIIGTDLEKRVILTGYVDDETLACLYSGAAAFVYPSLYEGFGLPILEAMACGCAVICSNAASMPEAAGDAALQIDPTSIDDLSSAIDHVVTDDNFRSRMIEMGFSHAKKFTWERTARMSYEVFKTVSEVFRR